MSATSTEYWLGIDCGGTYLKAGLYDRQGAELCISRQALPVISEHLGWAERDMSLLWKACIETIATLLRQSGVNGQQVQAIGISAQGKGLFLLDKETGRWAMPCCHRIGERLTWCRNGNVMGCRRCSIH